MGRREMVTIFLEEVGNLSLILGDTMAIVSPTGDMMPLLHMRAMAGIMELRWEMTGAARLESRMKEIAAIINTAAPTLSGLAPITHLGPSIALASRAVTTLLMTYIALTLRGNLLITHHSTTVALCPSSFVLRGNLLITHHSTTIALCPSSFVTIIVLAPRGTALIIDLVVPGSHVLVMKIATAVVPVLTLNDHGTIHLQGAEAVALALK